MIFFFYLNILWFFYRVLNFLWVIGRVVILKVRVEDVFYIVKY